MTLRRIGDVYALIFGWPVLAKLHWRASYLCSRALGLHNYASARLAGERQVITHCLRGRATPVVFDVGANEGDWLDEVLRQCPSAQVHAFEPQAALAQRLAARAPSVRVNAVAVGDRLGELPLHDYADLPGSQHASLVDGVIHRIHGAASKCTVVPVITLDGYCAERSVEHIDLLKIDVEGFEMSVLNGAARMLEQGRVDAIQFEFNEMNLASRTFVNDFFARLSPAHVLYRILPHGLWPLHPQQHWFNEQFVFQNILALRRQEG